MCEWGDSVELLVPISADVSYTGKFRWATKGVDRCLVPFVRALNDAGLFTDGCCCGHSRPDQEKFIGLHDGTVLTFTQVAESSCVGGG